MAIWLNRLSTDRLNRSAAPSNRPLALYAKIGNAFALTAVDARAAKLGLHKGMALSDARAIFPALDAREADTNADAKTLDDIAVWCERFTPVVILDASHGLFLDITGCAHLYGGEKGLLAEAKTRLSAQGFSNRCAIAPSPGAAWALRLCRLKRCGLRKTPPLY
jgi:protein ImuB